VGVKPVGGISGLFDQSGVHAGGMDVGAVVVDIGPPMWDRGVVWGNLLVRLDFSHVEGVVDHAGDGVVQGAIGVAMRCKLKVLGGDTLLICGGWVYGGQFLDAVVQGMLCDVVGGIVSAEETLGVGWGAEVVDGCGGSVYTEVVDVCCSEVCLVLSEGREADSGHDDCR